MDRTRVWKTMEGGIEFLRKNKIESKATKMGRVGGNGLMMAM